MYEYQNRTFRIGIGAVEIMIIINFIMFIPALLRIESIAGLFYDFFTLRINYPVRSINTGAIWQLLTSIFMHSPFSMTHIIFNMLALYMFGKPLEIKWGKTQFTIFYLAVGILANILTVVFFIFSNQPVRLLGASGAVFGVLLAFGTYYPDTRLLLFFVIPIKAKWAILLFAAVEIITEITGTMSGIAHITHLAGFLFAYLYFLIFLKLDPIKEMFLKNDYYHRY